MAGMVVCWVVGRLGFVGLARDWRGIEPLTDTNFDGLLSGGWWVDWFDR